jgi:hypothetical protein
MRRLLSKPPKAFKYELIGQLTRATINATDDYKPFTFVPYQPHHCPVCGNDAGKEDGHIAVILALEFADGEKLNHVLYSHKKCFEECIETNEPDADLEEN